MIKRSPVARPWVGRDAVVLPHRLSWKGQVLYFQLPRGLSKDGIN
jgi:hypothetical protein